jgi:Type IV secretion system pilin
MKKIITLLAVFAPSVAFAQAITDINSLTYKLTNLGNTFIEILIAFSVIFIIYSVVIFIMHSDSEDKGKYQGRVIWGVVGLFVILSIWGLVRILTNTFRTDTNAPTSQYPHVQYPTQVP